MEWKLLEVEQVTHNRFLNYFVLHYSLNGKPYDYYMASRKKKEDLRVFHEASSYFPDGVMMVVCDYRLGKRRIALIQEFRPCFGKYVTSLPAGLIDPGESIIEGATREAREEIGVHLKNVRLLFPACPTSEGMSDEMICGIYGEIDGYVGEKPEDNEDISWRLYDDEELRAMLVDPSLIIPAPTRFSLLWALNYVPLPE